MLQLFIIWNLDPQVLTVGALHQADFAALRSAASTWHKELASLPKPLLVVNIGGPSSNYLLLVLENMKLVLTNFMCKSCLESLYIVCVSFSYLSFSCIDIILTYPTFDRLALPCIYMIYTGNCRYGVDLAKQLAAMLQNVIWSCGTVRISFSRRTPEKVPIDI